MLSYSLRFSVIIANPLPYHPQNEVLHKNYALKTERIQWQYLQLTRERQVHEHYN